MQGTSRRIVQILARHTSASAIVSNVPAANPVTTAAALRFMSDVAKSNTEERHLRDDKFNRAVEKFSSELDSFHYEFDSLRDTLEANTAELIAALKALKLSNSNLNRKITWMLIPSTIAMYGALAYYTFDILSAFTAPVVVAKSVEVVASTPWYHFW